MGGRYTATCNVGQKGCSTRHRPLRQDVIMAIELKTSTDERSAFVAPTLCQHGHEQLVARVRDGDGGDVAAKELRYLLSEDFPKR